MNKIKSNFEGQTIYVGMDVHKARWNLGKSQKDSLQKTDARDACIQRSLVYP